MSLFLESAIAATVTEPQVTFHESQQALVESIQMMGELTEAILVADFAIHERTRGLEESALLEAEQGFLTKIATKVKEFLVAVKTRLVAFWQGLVARVKALWAKLTGNASNIKVPKSLPEALSELTAALDKVHAAFKGGESDAGKYKTEFEKAVKEFEKATKALDKVKLEKEQKSWIEVKYSQLSKVQEFGQKSAIYAASVGAELDKEIKAAEKAAAKAKGDEAESAKKEVELARAKGAAANKLASLSNVVAGCVFFVVAARTGTQAKP